MTEYHQVKQQIEVAARAIVESREKNAKCPSR